MPAAPPATYAFTKLVVHDLEAMAGFYEEVYGLTRLQRVEAEIDGAPIDEIILGIDGSHGGLILLCWVGQPAPRNGEVILGFTTPDIERLFARATAAGATVREAPKRSQVADVVVGFLEDPEGHLTEVVERP